MEFKARAARRSDAFVFAAHTPSQTADEILQLKEAHDRRRWGGAVVEEVVVKLHTRPSSTSLIISHHPESLADTGLTKLSQS